MTALELLDHALSEEAPPQPRRSIKRLLLPLFREVANAYAWRAESVGFWHGAFVLALVEILAHYRRLIAFGGEL
jgi:hypothetical protein